MSTSFKMSKSQLFQIYALSQRASPNPATALGRVIHISLAVEHGFKTNWDTTSCVVFAKCEDRATVVILGSNVEPWVIFATSLLHVSVTLLRFGVLSGPPSASLGPRVEKSTFLTLTPPRVRS